MALSDKARDWWRRRGYDAKAENYDKGQAREVSRYQLPKSDDFETGAEGTRNIPFTVYPTHTINPERPRTIAAGYDRKSQTLRLRFRPGASHASPTGAVYDYYDVSPNEWKAVQKTVSTGRYLNSQLSAKDYTRLH